MQVSDRGFDVGVAQQLLEYEDIGALIKLVGGKAVAQGMDAATLGQADFFFALLYILWAELIEIGCLGLPPGNSHCPGW